MGQVNGLSVLEIGGYAFGKPVRITATAALGKSGLINIERESNLSGRFHDKGMHIIAGIHAQPLRAGQAAVARREHLFRAILFRSGWRQRQFHGSLRAALRAFANLPLRQDVAVTGSMNQRGDIQAIGGVNEKIEGFFDVCRIYGLTGTQGVMIPAANVEDLMLREDLLDAVASGNFHIWPISRIEQGIELLTGVKAGHRNGDGAFPGETVFAKVDVRLREMARMMKEFE